MPEESAPGDMRRLSPRLADAEIDRRLTVINRHQLAVDISHVQQRDVAERVELQQFVLRQALARHGACEIAAYCQRRCGGADLQDLAACHHRLWSAPDARYAEFETLALGRKIHFQVAVFLGIRRQFVGANVDLAPLEALANVPDLLLAGAPGREMVVLALRRPQPLPADPMVGGAEGPVRPF